MVLQYIIVGLILLAALLYVVYLIRETICHANDKCYGCAGCAIHDRLKRKRCKAEKDAQTKGVKGGLSKSS
ncbi:hypothetical protein KZY59_00155 [Prevotella buccae]|uniref:hypothetical protein n=1 Tax=Segatella buccae TaxID=28126 RepID=UPI001C5E1439|nr:hypothetical protein [Segatella buccae]MBW4869969.1 hypothetical protein [Segatella buccae]